VAFAARQLYQYSAQVVKFISEWRVQRKAFRALAEDLNGLGIQAARGGVIPPSATCSVQCYVLAEKTDWLATISKFGLQAKEVAKGTSVHWDISLLIYKSWNPAMNFDGFFRLKYIVFRI
jgi:hypothetical protein